LFGELAPQFWVGYVALGLVIPLLAEVAIPGIAVGQGMLWIMTVSALGPIGGFLLRLRVVSLGAKTPLLTFGGSFVIPQNM
jgi:formate-dependent nitrite reductase membrane component NrfD